MSKFLNKLIRTEDDVTLTVIRLTLGGVMFAHGAQKVLGWFGGYGFGPTMGFLTAKAGLPGVVAFLVILIEFAGSLALIAGAAGRLMALGIASVMAGAIFTTHLKVGFFMNWAGNLKGEGIEYHLLAIAMAAAVMIKGSGAFSVDRWLARRLESGTERSSAGAFPAEATSR